MDKARALIAPAGARAATGGLLIAVALGYTAARLASPPSSMSSAVLLMTVLVVAILAIVYGLKQVLLAAAILGVPFQFDKNLFYDYGLSAHGAVGGISLSVTTLALVGLYVLWISELMLDPHRADQPRLRWALPPFTYIVFAVVSVTVASNLALTLNELALLAQCLLLFIYLSSTVHSLAQLRTLVFLLLLGLVLQASLLVLQYYTGVSIQFAGLSSRERIEETTRVAGTLGSPNSAGGFLAACIAVAVALFIARGVRSGRVLPAVGIFIGTLALVLTFSRGGWLAGVIATTLLVVFLSIRRQLTPRILVVTAIVAVLGFLMGSQIQSRLESQTGGLKAREAVGEIAVNVIRDHPLLGVGVNNYVTILSDYTPLSQWAFVPHNKFLLTWSETGIVGLLAFVFFLLATAHRGWLALRQANQALLPYAVALNAAFIALLIHMNFEPFHGRLQLMFLFLVAALLHVAAHIARETENDVKWQAS